MRRGEFVEVPLGNAFAIGLVVDLDRAPRQGIALKPLRRLLPGAPVFGAATRRFLQRAARYVCAPPGRMLAMAMRHHGGIDPPPTTPLLTRAGPLPGRATPARGAVLEALDRTGPVSASELAREAGVSASVIAGLVAAGTLERRAGAVEAPFPVPDPSRRGETLTPEQERATAALRVSMLGREFAAVLLDGVTGSGKTEIYMEAIASLLKQDPAAQALILLPEISLSRALMARIARRFGAEPAQWHSGVSPARKRRVWREAAFGRARIVVGARSALFLPFARLRAVIVDEEHDQSYKQDENPAHNARDLAVLRAQCEGGCVVLASATPSLETLANARRGRYRSIELRARPGAATLPDIEIVDRGETPWADADILSPPLISAMNETLGRGEQVLLFLNRRGYAPVVVCRACHRRLGAPESDTWLCEHRRGARLVCHLTGFSMARPKQCPHCAAPDSLSGFGYGVERLSEQTRRLFGDVGIALFSSDTASDAEAAHKLLARMEAGEVRILIGTQMVAKGHNFPRLTLVGVVDADGGMKGADPRAAERTYQLLLQVAGRAGRATRPGRAILQTWDAAAPALRALAAGDREHFVALEMRARERNGMPPFGRLGAVIVSAPTAAAADAACGAMSLATPGTPGFEVWGPAPAPISLLRGRHRRRYLVRAGLGADMSAFLSAWRSRARIDARTRVVLDVDPYNFL